MLIGNWPSLLLSRLHCIKHGKVVTKAYFQNEFQSITPSSLETRKWKVLMLLWTTVINRYITSIVGHYILDNAYLSNDNFVACLQYSCYKIKAMNMANWDSFRLIKVFSLNRSLWMPFQASKSWFCKNYISKLILRYVIQS